MGRQAPRSGRAPRPHGGGRYGRAGCPRSRKGAPPHGGGRYGQAARAPGRAPRPHGGGRYGRAGCPRSRKGAPPAWRRAIRAGRLPALPEGRPARFYFAFLIFSLSDSGGIILSAGLAAPQKLNRLWRCAAKGGQWTLQLENATPAGAPGPAGGQDFISAFRGAREHNLKNIDVNIPRGKLVVITGLSRFGQVPPLAFDTIYAEGQRRYVESLSAYARQFLEMMEKQGVESITGPDANGSRLSRRTGSSRIRARPWPPTTEIYDYLRVLLARAGTPHCHRCRQGDRKPVGEQRWQYGVPTRREARAGNR